GLVPEGGVAVSDTSHDATTARPKDTWATWRRAVVRRFTAVDLVTLLYVAVATVAVLAFTADDRTGWDWLLLAHALLVALVLLALRLSGRLDAARRTIFAVMITFYLCYVVFLFFPVAGPRYAFDLAHNAATEIWPARATQWLLDRGDSWGAAFPSSHVAAAVVATICALRYWRPLGLALVPL